MPFELNGERVCKAKWAEWFKAGGWIVQDFTKPESAKLQIAKFPVEYQQIIRDFLNCFNFPHDGEATRKRFTFCFDYKYHRSTPYGIWIEKEDYDKDFSYQKRWFYYLMWAEDKQKRFMHQLRNPINYKVKPVGEAGTPYYMIPDADWVEPDNMLNKLFTIPEALSDRDSLAFQFAVTQWVESGHHGDPVITKADKVKAERMFKSLKPGFVTVLRETSKQHTK